MDDMMTLWHKQRCIIVIIIITILLLLLSSTCNLTVIALMSDSCPVNVCLHMPSRMSHICNEQLTHTTLTQYTKFMYVIFLPRCIQCRRSQAMRKLSVRPSIRLSVCPSVKRVNCDKTGWRLVPTSMTFNDLERRNSPYFAFSPNSTDF